MAQAHIGEEIINQKLVLSNLCTQWNSHSFIFRLPTETLETVFIHCARDHYSEDRGDPIPTAPSWVNVSYVCRHWRNVALNCPTLWTYLFITSPRWTEELLARSKQASLKLRVNFHPQGNRLRGLCFVEQVVNHLERIQELRLDLWFSDSQVFPKLSAPAARCKLWNFRRMYMILRGPRYFLTETLRPCLSGLTTLSLHYVPVRLQQSMAEFLAALSCMQDLTHLYLEDVLASATGYMASNKPQVNLPHLSRLLLAAPLSTFIAFLSCVNIPLQAEIRLSCGAEPGSSFHDYTSISSLLAQRFTVSEDQALSGPTVRSLGIEHDLGKAILTFSAAERDCGSFTSLSYTEWRCNIPLQLVLYLDQSPTMRGNWNHIVRDICCSVPLSNVQSLHARDIPYPLGFWMHVLAHLPDLRYIKLVNGHIPELASVLSITLRDCMENQGEDVARAQCQIFAPALEELELYNIVFLSALEGDIDPPKVDGVQSICDALATRKEPLGRLTMTQCTIWYADQKKQFDMEVWWEGGRFYVIDLKVYSGIF
ncbi:hypothetical protein OG21DRAFT_1496328 [Imleria badia]|nr:hypothetical protein OG21DRAFT_1496328 [Imleria badia]